jgi:hypothetical protein
MGNFAKAVVHYKADLQIAFRSRDQGWLPQAYRHLFSSYIAMGDYSEAFKMAELQLIAAQDLYELIQTAQDPAEAAQAHSSAMENAFYSRSKIECTLHTCGKVSDSWMSEFYEVAIVASTC